MSDEVEALVERLRATADEVESASDYAENGRWEHLGDVSRDMLGTGPPGFCLNVVGLLRAAADALSGRKK